jgi:hypothetical protein
VGGVVVGAISAAAAAAAAVVEVVTDPRISCKRLVKCPVIMPGDLWICSPGVAKAREGSKTPTGFNVFFFAAFA